MILTVIIPAYFPASSDCARVQSADVIVIADTFIFSKHQNAHRTAIKTVDGKRWLTIPVLSKNRQGQTIASATIDTRQSWAARHLRTLSLNYQNSSYFYLYADAVDAILRQNSRQEKVIELLSQTMQFCFCQLGLKGKILFSHELSDHSKDRTERVHSWLNALHCSTYLLPRQQAGLIDVGRLKRSGKRVQTMTYRSEPYHQQFEGFVSDLSVLDLLFNEGPYSADLLIRNKQINSVCEIES